VEAFMKITVKGQVTIPQEIRERHGLLPGTEVEFVDDGEEVRLVKAEGGRRRGRALVERMRGRADTRLSTDEIMALTRGDS
jgi:AbrB family looped-hinge helix DNA binding protein